MRPGLGILERKTLALASRKTRSLLCNRLHPPVGRKNKALLPAPIRKGQRRPMLRDQASAALAESKVLAVPTETTGSMSAPLQRHSLLNRKLTPMVSVLPVSLSNVAAGALHRLEEGQPCWVKSTQNSLQHSQPASRGHHLEKPSHDLEKSSQSPVAEAGPRLPSLCWLTAKQWMAPRESKVPWQVLEQSLIPLTRWIALEQ